MSEKQKNESKKKQTPRQMKRFVSRIDDFDEITPGWSPPYKSERNTVSKR